ncbi:MAG: N-acetylmuramoyl-L-alanine amidase, partial [Candidatus Acidiferrales bacterium]
YKRVYLITSHSEEVPLALNHIAELYRTMGDLFEEKYYQSAINSYQFLLREYPTTRLREEALLSVAHIEQDDLHDPVLAQNTYQQFLALHPRSSHAAEVRQILAKLKQSGAEASASPRNSEGKNRAESPAPVKADSGEKSSAESDTKQDSKVSTKQDESSDDSQTHTKEAQVSRIRTWNANTYTRIVIDVGSQVKYQAARISRPDRIYFDIDGAKVNPALLHQPITVEDGGFLKDVRVAQYQAKVVRVVLEVNQAKDYSVFLLPDPYRLVVDVYGTSAAATRAALSVTPPSGPTTETPAAKPGRPSREALGKTFGQPSAKNSDDSPKKAEESAVSPAVAVRDKDQTAADFKTLSAGAAVPVSIESGPSADHSPATKKSSRGGKSAHEQAEEMGPPPVPELMRDGQQSLTRALGLKIGRIVIDAGHGGHDTGTIGPTGLMEKDLCLDVALRLGKLIQKRLPGAEVVYTRTDDTFVPLEERTQIANDAHADLF